MSGPILIDRVLHAGCSARDQAREIAEITSIAVHRGHATAKPGRRRNRPADRDRRLGSYIALQIKGRGPRARKRSSASQAFSSMPIIGD